MTTAQTERIAGSERAYRTVLAYHGENESIEEDAVELMANLLHLIDLDYGIQPEDALRSAWHRFMSEKNEAER